MKLCITGCGRSGTKFTATLLQQLGVKVLHEKMGEEGIVSSTMAVRPEEPRFGPPYPKEGFELTLHQVRNPLDVIGSSLTANMNNMRWAAQYVPIDVEASRLKIAVQYWYYWNKETEKHADHRYKLEDIENIFPQFCEWTGAKQDIQVYKSIPKNTNTRQHKTVSWAEIELVLNDMKFYKKCRKLEEEYGY